MKAAELRHGPSRSRGGPAHGPHLPAPSASAGEAIAAAIGLEPTAFGVVIGSFVTGSMPRERTTAAASAIRRAGALRHPPGLFWRAGQRRLDRLDRGGGLLLGVVADAEYETVRVPLAAGDRLVLYTDGLVEAANASDEPFDEGRLQAFMADHASLSAPSFADGLLRRVQAWSGRPALDDDVTLMVLDVR